jgi:hypothetical protein
MYLSSSSAAGVRFLAAIKDGHGLKPSARQAGIDKEISYRWLRENYVQLRRDGKTAAETIAIIFALTPRRRPHFGFRSIAATALRRRFGRRRWSGRPGIGGSANASTSCATPG